ncbi:MAG: OmpA family protein [Rhodobacteraceae bacterium]|nr:MAG: OmpA family protein [Paracoccaceae bacterium]
MGTFITKALRTAATGCATAVVFALLSANLAEAQAFSRDTPSQRGRDQGQYIPNIVLTPDGCEVWAADDGAEGYASNRLTRKGTPICHEVNTCGLLNSDQFFATDSYRIHAKGKERLREFFRNSTAFAYTIVGHTDSRASHEYNLRLSHNRANAVARVAVSVGAKIVDVRGMGETAPVASNRTREGMARNRRVEILCFQ